MDFNKLNTFCMVAQMQSVTLAATKLYRTQSAISQQLLSLEDELGMSLLDRRGSKIFLTREGELLYEFAKPRLQQIVDETTRLKNDSNSLSGVLRIAALDEVYEYFLPELISEFSNEYPNIEISIIPSDHVDTDLNIINNHADLGFMILYEDPDLYEKEPYYCFKRICVCSPEYLKKFGRISSLEDIVDMNMIDASFHLPSLKFWIKKNCPNTAKIIKDKTAFISVRGADAQKKLLLNGKGIGMAHDFLVKEELASGALVQILPKKTKPIHVVVDLARKRKFTPQLIHERFIDFAMNYSKENKLNVF